MDPQSWEADVSPAGAVAVDVKIRVDPTPPGKPDVRALREP